jgi:hypothetical protein
VNSVDLNFVSIFPVSPVLRPNVEGNQRLMSTFSSAGPKSLDDKPMTRPKGHDQELWSGS